MLKPPSGSAAVPAPARVNPLPYLVLAVAVLGSVSGFVMLSGGIGPALTRVNALFGHPIAADDAVAVSEGVPDQPIKVLGNDQDPDGGELRIVAAVSASHGTLRVEGRRLLYSPEPGFVGVDRGGYTVRDAGGGLASATVTISVVPNGPPLAVPDRAIATNGAAELDVLANDGDPDGQAIRLVSVSDPASGTAVIEGSMIAYQADAGFSGIDRLRYTVSDELGLESVAFVDVSVPGASCEASDARRDDDGDRYDNRSEIDGGSDPCDAGSTPPDADGDGTADHVDPFFLDPADGLATAVPFRLSFDRPVPGTVLDTGFTGVMWNGETPMELLDPASIGIADGALHISSGAQGDAFGAANSQRNAMHIGVRMPVRPFVIHARLHLPFAEHGFQSAGIYVGSGGQDDYLKLAVSAAGGEGGVKVTYEVDGDGRGAALRRDPEILGDAVEVDLYLRIDPRTRMSESSYRINGGQRLGLGASAHLPIPEEWTSGPRALAIGVVITPELNGPDYSGTWDLLEIKEEGS